METSKSGGHASKEEDGVANNMVLSSTLSTQIEVALIKYFHVFHGYGTLIHFLLERILPEGTKMKKREHRARPRL